MSKAVVEERQVFEEERCGVTEAMLVRMPALKTAAGHRPGWPINTEIPGHSPPLAVFVSYISGGLIHVGLDNCCAFVFPVNRVESLATARSVDLRQVWIESAGQALHWPRLRVRLSISALMRGELGSPDWMRQQARRIETASALGVTATRKPRATQSSSSTC